MLSLLLLSACGNFGNEYGDEALPTSEQLAINMPIASDAGKSPSDPEDWAMFYESTRTITEDINGMIGFVLGTVTLVVTTQEPSWVDDGKTTAMWGPYSDSGLDPVETGITVEKLDDGGYNWAIFQVPNGGTVDADSVVIVAGSVDPGATREAAVGSFLLDYSAANALDPSVHLVGRWDVRYAYDAGGVAATVAADDYGWEGLGYRDAFYTYDEDYEGAGEMDLAYEADVNGSGTRETITLKSRWQADGMGRGDAQIIDGDVEPEVKMSECWGTDFLTSYWTDTIELHDVVGIESDCAFAESAYADAASFAVVEASE